MIKLRKYLAITALAVAALVGGGSANAVTLAIGDANYVGSVTPGGGSPSTEQAQINALIDLAAGATDTTCPGLSGQTCNREGSTLAGLPDATGMVKLNDDGSTTITLDGTFNYILGKYDAGKAGSLVWYFADGITGEITLPGTFNGHGLSHITGGTSGSTSTSTTSTSTSGDVPEPGTLTLLGLGLLGFGYMRRFRKA